MKQLLSNSSIKIKNLIMLSFILLMPIIIFITFNNKTEVKANSNYPTCTAKSMIVIDANCKRKLYEKNAYEKLPMASTTKIVTALTVLDNCKNLDAFVSIDDEAIGIPGTSIYLKKGEVLTVKELLYGMMLPSGNDAATALAIYIGGNINNFCKMMQETAIKSGAFNSSFANPHGLDAKNHYTTAYDLALISARALDNETFKEIVTTKNIRIKGYDDQKYRYLKNKNKLLLTLDGCIGVKTGFTDDAGRCLVSACERDGQRSVCVVLNCGPMFEESFTLLSKSFEDYSNYEILKCNQYHKLLKVQYGKQSGVKVGTKKSFNYSLKKDEYGLIRFEYELPEIIKTPIKFGQEVGVLKIYLKNDLLFCEKIYTMENVKSIGVISSIKEIATNW